VLDFDVARSRRHRRADDPVHAEQRQPDRRADDVGNRIDRSHLVKMDLAERRAVDFRFLKIDKLTCFTE